MIPVVGIAVDAPFVNPPYPGENLPTPTPRKKAIINDYGSIQYKNIRQTVTWGY